WAREGLEILEAVREAHVPEEFRAGFLEDKAEACASAVHLELSAGPGDARRVEEAFALAERFRARSFLDRLRAAPRRLADVQRALGDARAALVEIVASERGWLAFVATSSGARAVELPMPDDVDRLVDAGLRELMH